VARVKEENLNPVAQSPGIRAITNLATDAPSAPLAAVANTDVQRQLAEMTAQYNTLLAGNPKAKAAAAKIAAEKAAADKVEADRLEAAKPIVVTGGVTLAGGPKDMGGPGGDDPYNSDMSTVSTGSSYKPPVSDETKDAYALVKEIFRNYGLEDLYGPLEDMMRTGVGANEAALLLKTSDKYNKDAQGNPIGYAKRFAGNTARLKQGLNVIDEGTYLAMEKSYENTLRNNGLGTMLSTDRNKNNALFADYIAKDIDTVEFKNRIDTAVDLIQNANAATKRMAKEYYGITDLNLIEFALSPEETAKKLEAKANAARFGGIAANVLAGTEGAMAPSEAYASSLVKSGLTDEQVSLGYQNVADVLPTTKKLSDIYQESGSGYTQQMAESEFLDKNASAAAKRKRFASLERGTFSSDSGQTNTAFASKNYSLNNTSAGQY